MAKGKIDPIIQEARERRWAGIISPEQLRMYEEKNTPEEVLDATDWGARGLRELAGERERALSFPWGPLAALGRAAAARADSAEITVQAVGASAPPDDLVVVLVISESLRPDHLGINGYQRDTTPELAKLGTELLSFSDVAATANFTLDAVPSIIGRSKGGRHVSLVSVFKEAGFRTAWLSNQDKVLEPGADSVPELDSTA